MEIREAKAKDFEGRGYAKQFLNHVIELAPKRGIKAIRIDVLEGYSVLKMYEKFDFKYIKTVEIFYEDIGRPRNFALLERVI